MNSALKKLSKSELIDLVDKQNRQMVDQKKRLAEREKLLADQEKNHREKMRIHQQTERLLKEQIAELKRQLFGQKRERFLSHPDQGELPFDLPPQKAEEQQKQLREKITYERKKVRKTAHKGRLPLPDHLPVKEIDIHPEGDLSEMVCIGKQVTEELEMRPAEFYIIRYNRYKYAPKDKNTDGGVLIGELPDRVIDKCIAGPGLLASVLIDKYVDHLPLYRQRQRFLRENIPIASSTLEGWAAMGMDRLDILYQHLVSDTKAQGYLQADETRIPVLDSNKKGATHQGYFWVYHNPIDRCILYDYQPTRGGPSARNILKGFQGYLQTDGYGVYDKIGASKGVTHLGCWAHARRKFEKALENDLSRAQHAMLLIQGLYAVERQARQQKLSPADRKELRLEKSLPIIKELGRWMLEQLPQVLPKSVMGKALAYTVARWEQLQGYLYDGLLEIDNNLVENAIRPVALGRKNYLFAGSHKAAERAAAIYSFMAMCKAHQVNPHKWLKYVFENIMTTKFKDIRSLYPQNFKSNL